MKLAASSKFSPVDMSRITARLIPKLTSAMQESVKLVQTEAQAIVPVDTGELKASIGTSVEWSGTSVNGEVFADAPHAAFVEYGTGIRGAASPGAGPYPYSPGWPGMPAQPFLRPSLDNSKAQILSIFEKELRS